MNTTQRFVRTHLPCPDSCGLSTDAFCLREDGSGYCFGQCGGKNFKPEKGELMETSEFEKPVTLTVGFHPHRGILESSFRFYDVETKFADGEPFEVGFPYKRGIKVRKWGTGLPEKGKKFRSVGDMKDPDLFGMDKFDPGSRESITITAGEYDAISIFQVTGGRTAAVSLPSGTLGQALKCVIKHRDYIDSFNKIYLCLDNDEADRETTRELSVLFDFAKVYEVKFNKHKDANDYLLNNEGDDLFSIWRNAKRFSPDNVISSFGDIEKALSDANDDQIGTYPWDRLNGMTYGIHKGEVVVFKGLEKIGKTEIFRAMEHHLLKTTSHNMIVIHLEENVSTTIKGIAGYELDAPAMLPDCGLSNSDIFQGYKKAVGDNDNRIHLYSSYDVGDEKLLYSNIRFLVGAYGVKFVFLDHISWLGTGLDIEDERKTLDRISQKLKLLAKELGFALIMISHVNDNGQTRGSRNITKVCDTIIHLERDKISPDENIRNTTYMTIEGVRLGGQSGPAGEVIMDKFTRKLREVQPFDDPARISFAA